MSSSRPQNELVSRKLTSVLIFPPDQIVRYVLLNDGVRSSSCTLEEGHLVELGADLSLLPPPSSAFVRSQTPFRPEDWARLKKIADGNPDESKIGAFGVG